MHAGIESSSPQVSVVRSGSYSGRGSPGWVRIRLPQRKPVSTSSRCADGSWPAPDHVHSDLDPFGTISCSPTAALSHIGPLW